jgi:hypothetical protein
MDTQDLGKNPVLPQKGATSLDCFLFCSSALPRRLSACDLPVCTTPPGAGQAGYNFTLGEKRACPVTCNLCRIGDEDDEDRAPHRLLRWPLTERAR